MVYRWQEMLENHGFQDFEQAVSSRQDKKKNQCSLLLPRVLINKFFESADETNQVSVCHCKKLYYDMMALDRPLQSIALSAFYEYSPLGIDW